MVTRVRILMFAALVVAAGPIAAQRSPSTIPAENTADWLVDTAARAHDVKIAPFLDRSALWLRNGTQATKAGVQFTDGTIELDVAPMARGDFVAIIFRRESAANHENIYLRPRQSGEFMAIQYAPRTNGSSTWQLYPEFTATATWPRNAWTHVRVEVRGSTLQVFVGDTATPTLSVPRLRHVSSSGEVGFWARVNNQPAEWAAALSNITIRPAASDAPRIAAPAPIANAVADWQVAGPVAATAPVVSAIPGGLEWRAARAEESGLVNLNRLFPAQPQKGRATVFLRATVDAASARHQLAGIGYSDEVTVFVNGEPIYTAANGFDSRIPGYIGFVDPRFERVWLPLRAGANDVVLAVTDDQRFGWGASLTWESSGS